MNQSQYCPIFLISGDKVCRPSKLAGRRGTLAPSRKHLIQRGRELIAYAAPDPLVSLGNDFLLFLGATVLVVPLFKSAKQSPVLGYLFAGLVMGQLGLFRDPDDIEKLSELGVLFLLFEMGLELTFDKLQKLAKYAFGLGTLQVVLCTIFFTAVALPAGNGIMTIILEKFLHAPPSLVGIRTVDEAVVIAVALSLSSSAFVLQLLKERGELESKFGRATLGILLFQDIATVPFLVLLPLVEASGGVQALGDGGVLPTDAAGTIGILQELGPTALKTLGGVGLVLLGGRTVLRRLFELVAEAKSSETFIALCLLSVTGASLLTQRLGFSDTLGAFLAGVLLAETNFKAQVEADIQPFRGILLGLFFVTTGSSLDLTLFVKEWPIVLTLLAGLLALKTTVITLIGPIFGLTKQESVRTAFSLSQGGEFAFVLLSLANELRVLPEELNRLLIIVVVLSMAVTPALTEAGKRVADMMPVESAKSFDSDADVSIDDPVMICGFGDVGQAVANLLSSLEAPIPYVAFDLTVSRVAAAKSAGFNVLYGDGFRPKVLSAAGISVPRAIVVGYTARQRAVTAVESLATAFPEVPLLVRALDTRHAAELSRAGASTVIIAEAEAGLAVAARTARLVGAPPEETVLIARAIRKSLSERTLDYAVKLDAIESSEGEDSEKKDSNVAALASAAAAIFKFDGTNVSWKDGPRDDLVLSDTELAEIEASGPLGASVLASILSSVDTDAVAATSSRGSRDGSRDGSIDDDFPGLTERIVIQMSSKPDGSVDCPVIWDGVSSVSEDK